MDSSYVIAQIQGMSQFNSWCGVLSKRRTPPYLPCPHVPRHHLMAYKSKGCVEDVRKLREVKEDSSPKMPKINGASKLNGALGLTWKRLVPHETLPQN